jgi:hypothetical protein
LTVPDPLPVGCVGSRCCLRLDILRKHRSRKFVGPNVPFQPWALMIASVTDGCKRLLGGWSTSGSLAVDFLANCPLIFPGEILLHNDFGKS